MRSTTCRVMLRISDRARFAPRQKCTPPPPKATWSLGVAADVEAVGIGEHVGVPVGGHVVDDDLVAGLDGLAVEHGVAGGRAAEVVDRRAPAQHLLDRARVEAGVVAQPLRLVGMVDEGQRAVVDEVPGRLVAGHDQGDEEQVQLEVVEAVAVDLGLDEGGHQVVAGVGPAIGGDVVAVHVDLGRRVGPGIRGGLELGVVEGDHRVAELEHAVPVGLGQPDHLADDLERELGRHVLDELALALLAHVVDDALRPGARSAPRAAATTRGVKPLLTRAGGTGCASADPC